MGELTLQTRIERFGPAAAIVLSEADVAAIGGGKRAPVRVSIDGRTARLRVAVMGGVIVVGLSKAARADLGVQIGDQVTVVLTLDEAPREVPVPVELEQALASDPAAGAAYQALAFTHRREFAEWVGTAVKPETRARRAEQAVAMLREGRTRS
ncbi:MAG TPA: YdeI/OmpD-associated family protein [Dermatophilaceae bacterium]|nr:YdeI/OmpD-associated family protein [Dermatophilaceae bacterium]